jgi:predicted nucleic acid-binding protein
MDVEFLHVLRRLVRTDAISQARADDARTDFDDLAIVRYPHQPHADRIWQLRDSESAYDAAFLALAEALGVPLITCDARSAHSSGHRALIEYFGTT